LCQHNVFLCQNKQMQRKEILMRSEKKRKTAFFSRPFGCWMYDKKRIAPLAPPRLLLYGWVPPGKSDDRQNPREEIFLSFQFEIKPSASKNFILNGKKHKAVYPQVHIWRPGSPLSYKYDGITEELYFAYSAADVAWVESMLQCFGLKTDTEFYPFNMNAVISGIAEDIKSLLMNVHYYCRHAC